MPKILVRPFALNEAPLYRELRLQAVADAPDAFGRTLAEERARPDAEWTQRIDEWTGVESRLALVALVDDCAIGLTFVRLVPDAPDVAQLFSMWVDPAARHAGIGRRLLDTTIEWSRARKVKRMTLQVAENNAAAIRLYGSAGFVLTTETEPLRPGSPLMARTMALTM